MTKRRDPYTGREFVELGPVERWLVIVMAAAIVTTGGYLVKLTMKNRDDIVDIKAQMRADARVKAAELKAKNTSQGKLKEAADLNSTDGY